MNSGLFKKLANNPEIKAESDELNEIYESIESNLINLMNEKSPTLSEMMQKLKDKNDGHVIEVEHDLHQKLFGRLQIYEPRLHEVQTDFILSQDNLVLQVKGMVINEESDTLHTFVFMIPVTSWRAKKQLNK